MQADKPKVQRDIEQAFNDAVNGSEKQMNNQAYNSAYDSVSRVLEKHKEEIDEILYQHLIYLTELNNKLRIPEDEILNVIPGPIKRFLTSKLGLSSSAITVLTIIGFVVYEFVL